ncbi:MAG: hypothetical protein R3Y63_14405 [Eubacteriales bacterium]
MRTMGKQEILIAYDEQPSSVYEIAFYTGEAGGKLSVTVPK